jgi:hypothetical protein
LLRKNNWHVSHQAYFYDSEERKSRALDIVAARLELVHSPKLDRFNVTLLIECKKSLDKPWVFYTTLKEEDHVADIGSLFLIKFISVPKFEPENYPLFWRSHYFLKEILRTATISYEPFSEGRRRQIFTATNQVLKALVYSRKTANETFKKALSIAKTSPELSKKALPFLKNTVIIYYPVIVFDGRMYECKLSDNNMEVLPVDYVQYQVSHETFEEIGGGTYLIDVVRKEFLVTYLGWLNKEIENMRHYVLSENPS